jgi:hypothetical protein
MSIVELVVLFYNYKSDGDAKFQLASAKRNAVHTVYTVELHLSGLSGTANHPDMYKIRITEFFL